MIYLERVITIDKGNASIDEQIVLYKGDKNVEIKFSIKNNPFKHQSGTLSHGQLVINREAGPIFSEVAQIINNKVIFVVTGDMIDEAGECGDYDFQIRLFNEDKTSRASLPPIEAGILIEKPICEEEGVNAATVNYSRTRSGEVLEPFDEEGNYNKTIWVGGDLITDSKLNKIEDAIYEINNDKSTSQNPSNQEIIDLEVSNSISMGRTGEIGVNSVALGSNCQAGDHSSAIGYGLIANTSRNGQVVVGRYNEENDNAFFIVGGGSIANKRKNILVVDGLGANVIGNLNVSGTFYAEGLSINKDAIFVNKDGSENTTVINSEELVLKNQYYDTNNEDNASAVVIRNDSIEIDNPNYTPLEDGYVTTKKYVDDAIANIDIPEVDLTGYATKDDIGDINAILDALNGEVI